MKKIRVAQIGNIVGGVDVHMRLISSNLNPEIFELLVIKNETDKHIPYLDRDNKEIRTITVPFIREVNLIRDIKSLIQLIKHLKIEQPDIIHAHSTKGGILGRLAAYWCGIPVVFTPHAFSFLSANNKIKRSFFIFIEKIIRKLGGTLIACSASERRLGVEIIGFKTVKAIVVNNGIENIKSVNEFQNHVSLPTNYICSVGRPSYQKNIEAMVDVIEILKEKNPDIHLVLLGVGEYSPNKDTIENLIVKKELQENITMVSWIPRKHTLNIIKNSQLYISTSRYEGLPYAIIEAMALSKATVAFDSLGNRDLVLNDYNGFLVKEGQVSEFANKVNLLLSNNEKKEKYERNALDRFKKHFEISRTILDLEKAYIDALEKANSNLENGNR